MPSVPGAITGAPSQKYSGIIDLRFLQVLIAQLAALEPGPWIPLVLTENLEFNPTGWEPASRIEMGNIVRLRGLIKVKAGKVLVPGATMFTLPAGQRPSKTAGVVAQQVLLGASEYVQFETSGEVKTGKELIAEQQLWLDGLTFSIT